MLAEPTWWGWGMNLTPKMNCVGLVTSHAVPYDISRSTLVTCDAVPYDISRSPLMTSHAVPSDISRSWDCVRWQYTKFFTKSFTELVHGVFARRPSRRPAPSGDLRSRLAPACVSQSGTKAGVFA